MQVINTRDDPNPVAILSGALEDFPSAPAKVALRASLQRRTPELRRPPHHGSSPCRTRQLARCDFARPTEEDTRSTASVRRPPRDRLDQRPWTGPRPPASALGSRCHRFAAPDRLPLDRPTALCALQIRIHLVNADNLRAPDRQAELVGDHGTSNSPLSSLGRCCKPAECACRHPRNQNRGSNRYPRA
jgi:hypothetical protein